MVWASPKFVDRWPKAGVCLMTGMMLRLFCFLPVDTCLWQPRDANPWSLVSHGLCRGWDLMNFKCGFSKNPLCVFQLPSVWWPGKSFWTSAWRFSPSHSVFSPRSILNAHRVPSTFHARFSALSRTYVYRLLMGCSHHSEIPVFERDLCWAPGGG